LINVRQSLKVRSRAPLRIGLAGGGTDLAGYYKKYGGFILNATINKYAYCEISRDDKGLTAISLDYSKEINIKNFNQHEKYDVPKELKLHIEVYRKIIKLFNHNKNFNCKITTCCDAPIGSGLGSSSTLVVSIIKAFDDLMNIGLDDYEISELAYEIERIDCGLNGGKQDQYAAAFGGLNFIEFKNDKTIVNPLKIKDWFKWELESSLILHFTGLSRSSADVIKDQTVNEETCKNNTLDYLHKIKKEAFIMKEAFLKCDKETIISSLKRSWEYKSSTSKKVTNKVIEETIKLGYKYGAEAAKVSGAGGGGFILFFAPPCHSIKLLNRLRKNSSETFFCSFTEQGAQSWNIYQ